MGLLADFFTADPADALRYANRLDDPDQGAAVTRLLNPIECKAITCLEIEMLWAIPEGTQWDVERHVLENTLIADDEESWLHRFPDELVTLLAAADATRSAHALVAWAAREEIESEPADLQSLLDDLQRLARQATDAGKSVYLWGRL